MNYCNIYIIKEQVFYTTNRRRFYLQLAIANYRLLDLQSEINDENPSELRKFTPKLTGMVVPLNLMKHFSRFGSQLRQIHK